MSKKINLWRIGAIGCMAFMMGLTAKANTTKASAASTYKRYVNADSLTIRKKASSSSEAMGYYSYGTKITCRGKSGNWTKVKKSGDMCYVYSSYLTEKKPSAENASNSKDDSQDTKTEPAKVEKGSSYATKYVTAGSLTIRSKASVDGDALGYLKEGDKVTCYSTKDGWTKISETEEKYVSDKYLSETKPEETASAKNGQDVADYGVKFVGNPYVWGGTSLTNGCDCSGFTLAVYKHFGIALPHSSISQRTSGKKVSSSERKAGDLICYDSIGGVGHVALYIGNDKVVHAGSEKTGIHISTWNYRSVNCIRRVLN